MTTERAALACAVCGIARRAGQAIMEIYTSDFVVQHKQDDSPLTAADLAAHQIIQTELAMLTPDWPILSEESADVPWSQRSQWQRYWLVDPLDGTREFIKRNGEFTVNIALIENHRPVLGVVYAPANSEMYSAWVGGGGFFSASTEADPLPLRTRSPATPLMVVGSRSYHDTRLEQQLLRCQPYELQPLGSSLKFCRIARGEADLYVRYGATSEWDTAAGQCILEQADGAVTDLQGRPLRYNRHESVINPDFLAVGDRAINWGAVFTSPV